MIEIRKLKESEIEQARKLVPADNAEPDWPNIWAVIKDGEVDTLMGGQVIIRAEPLYSKSKTCSLLAFGWLDAKLEELATRLGCKSYEFFVSDDRPDFQTFAQIHLPVTSNRERPGITFIRSFNGKE